MTTKSEVGKTDFKWQIYEVQKCSTGAGNNYGHSTNIRDPGAKMTWRLELEAHVDGFLYIRIGIRDDFCPESVTDSKTRVSLGLRICDANGRMIPGIEGFTEVPFIVIGKGHSYKLIRRDTVLGNPKLYLPNERLTVLCTIHYLTSDIKLADQLRTPSLVVPPPEAAPGMGNILEEARFSDVVIAAGGKEFPAHRAILAQRSDVFGAMFDADMAEKRDRRVTIEDLSAEVVGDLLTFIYTDSAPNIEKLASELLTAAEKYNIPRLKSVCEAQLIRSVEVDNAVTRLIESEMIGADKLKDAALLCIARNAADVVETESWDLLWKDHQQLSKEACEKMASYIKHLTE